MRLFARIGAIGFVAVALTMTALQLREERPDGEDAGLNQVLDHIDARVAVELAKAEMRRA